MEKKIYLKPKTNIFDYLARNGIMVDGDPTIPTSDFESKRFEEEENVPNEQPSPNYNYSVWDD